MDVNSILLLKSTSWFVIVHIEQEESKESSSLVEEEEVNPFKIKIEMRIDKEI